jgi:hypothetical protein
LGGARDIAAWSFTFEDRDVAFGARPADMLTGNEALVRSGSVWTIPPNETNLALGVHVLTKDDVPSRHDPVRTQAVAGAKPRAASLQRDPKLDAVLGLH